VDPDSSTRRRREPAPARQPLLVTVTDGRGRAVRDGGLARWLVRLAPKGARGDLGIALVTDERMRALNRKYRRKDYATDVLSFGGGGDSLGDLVIAKGVATRQARQARHSLQTELRLLALHGLLHLLGYDHESRTDNGRMARAETRLRKKGGLKAGLIDRAHHR
jgi:probable rRNA maturation factor